MPACSPVLPDQRGPGVQPADEALPAVRALRRAGHVEQPDRFRQTDDQCDVPAGQTPVHVEGDPILPVTDVAPDQRAQRRVRAAHRPVRLGLGHTTHCKTRLLGCLRMSGTGINHPDDSALGVGAIA